jgi:hypothetical protein
MVAGESYALGTRAKAAGARSMDRSRGRFADLARATERQLAQRELPSTPQVVDAAVSAEIGRLAVMLDLSPEDALEHAPAELPARVADTVEHTASAAEVVDQLSP